MTISIEVVETSVTMTYKSPSEDNPHTSNNTVTLQYLPNLAEKKQKNNGIISQSQGLGLGLQDQFN